MNILMITENDPAGMGIAFTNAMNRYTEHRCRLITKSTRYEFEFEKDLHVPDLLTQITTDSTDSADSDGFEEIRDVLKNADIIHFHILADENIELGPVKVKDFIKGKTLLHHLHGHPHFRAHPEKYRQKYRRLKRRVLVSTPDLLRLLPEATWQPNLVPINDLSLLPEPAPLNGGILIGQSVTRKDLKNTEDLLEVISKIQKIGLRRKIHLDIIENTDYRECLRRKNRCHIIFDHMQGYYGVSSLESLSQGKAVIAGLDDWNLNHIKEFAGTPDLPWVICRTRATLKEHILSLMNDSKHLTETGRASREFMCHHWSDEKVTKTLSSFYHTV